MFTTLAAFADLVFKKLMENAFPRLTVQSILLQESLHIHSLQPSVLSPIRNTLKDHVSAQMGVPLKSVLFFDDTLENVEAARQLGMQAVWVRGPHDVLEALDSA